MKVFFHLGIGYHGAIQEEELEFPDDATDEQIEADYIDWRDNYIEGYWEKVEGGKS